MASVLSRSKPQAEQQIVATPEDFEPDPETAKLVYDEMQTRVAIQNDQIAALDSKASIGLGSATIVAAVLALMQQAASGSLTEWSWSWWAVRIVAACALLVYVGTVWASYQAYQVRSFIVTPVAMTLINTIAQSSPSEAQWSLSWDRSVNLQTNDAEIGKKACWTKWTIKGVLAEAVLLAVIVILQVFI